MLETLVFRVAPGLSGYRLDRYLRIVLPGLPAKSIRFAIEGGGVSVGREKGIKGRMVAAGDEIVVRQIAEADDWMPVPEDVPGAALLYADEDVAVLSKPENVHTEPHRPMENGTLSGYLRWRFPEVESISREPGLTLLTRLDYSTSGAVPAALSAGALAFLQRERERGRLVKTYVCLVVGVVDKEMSLSFQLNSRGGETVRVITGKVDPDPLHWTDVCPIRVSGGQTLVKAMISRGKRHQIRAHLAAAGFPIVGDRKYGTVPHEGPGTTRLMLHAAEVRFEHPAGKGQITVTAPLPADFEVN